jgi:hypothetical protein
MAWPQQELLRPRRKQHMPMHDTWIAVPTYWTVASDAPDDAREETPIFDHPIPLNEEGTLVRTLESFVSLEGDFNVLVVAACSHPSLGQAVRDRVAELIAPLAQNLSLFLVGPPDVDRINAMLDEPILALTSYGNIRNVQLFVPYVLGARVVMGIDDDEIVENRDHVAKALAFIGKEFKGDIVGGMAGPYFDRKGEYRIEGAEELGKHGNIFIMKNHYMNEALKKAIDGPCPDGIVKSNVAFGGNMCMSRDTISKTCHDPYIPRGEDYDYVINAAMKGIWFFCRPDMWITHLPPDSTGSQAGDKMTKLAADIRRFIYVREKYTYHSEHYPDETVPLDYLLPYPGVYLDKDIDMRRLGIEALDEMYPEFREKQSPEEFVDHAIAVAKQKAEEFFRYREKWVQALPRAGEIAGMEDELKGLRIKEA